MSSSFIPLDVTAGVPILTPLVTNGLAVSKGTVFLLTVIPTSSSMCSASLPVTSLFLKSMSIRWLSVPPETRLKPSSMRASERALAFLTTCV